jgi:YfiH family protein
VVLLTSRRLAEAGFAHAFPERDATDAQLREALAAGRVLQVRQVHGARVVEAPAAEDEEADAIVARAAAGRVAVGVRVADCVPVLLADAESGDVAAVHAGWRGVVAGVVAAAVARLGGRARLLAAIGPCIGPCCFEVGRDVGDRIEAACGRVIVHASGAKAYVDLRRAVRLQLRGAGVSDAGIDEVAGCTKHEPERFHSFRRDGADSGRMLAAIATR